VRRIVLAVLVVLSPATSAFAHTTQVWPEISVFTRLNDRMRFYFLATAIPANIASCSRPRRAIR
jgi:hypothetical protein